MQFSSSDLHLLSQALGTLSQGFAELPDFQEFEPLTEVQISSILERVALQMQDNYPYAHPSYAGQMLKPPHALPRLAYMLALYLNPNNHALDGGRASSAMEKEAVAHLAQQLLGWEQALGHLSSSGTLANLEALWVAGKLHPDKKIVASDQAHYTHERISAVLGLEFEALASSPTLKLDLEALEQAQKTGQVGTVVLTLGSTGAGAIDPLAEVLALKTRYDFRIHVDAAYGGYFGLCPNLEAEAARHYAVLGQADSMVIDPHKQGLQPYGCGAVLFKDASVGRFYKHDSPYTYFSSADLHLGEISLECSRAGAAAVALWATLQAYPLLREGAFARRLAASRRAAMALHAHLSDNEEVWQPLFAPQTDIVLWSWARRHKLSERARANRALFEAAARLGLHLALFQVPASKLAALPGWESVEFDAPQLPCLRSCLMKPEHEAFMPSFFALLAQAEASL